MNDDSARWDVRYRSEEFLLGEKPSRFLAERIEEVKTLCPGRKALDIACGEGRNSIFLARHGFAVTGLDISPVAVEKARRWAGREGLDCEFLLADLEKFRFTETYDLIINFNFLLRDLIPREVAALTPGGVVIFDTILESPTAPVPHRKEFLLQPGELARLFAPYHGTILFRGEYPDSATPTAKLIYRHSS
ncbi:class I SAM-dependent methyltransferase [Geobacter grbiciae]|uniref:class I SAM-dependent methyltransferase n=1 Tax=Geobacter grbiciae TaxID=155042 RepID=UPI001C025921|nr:class I SAM-dependent methyltransferase [Geobacter grbiciae]MBT1076942.1 methyltransferase domain-containing protein [Geobacter grbiciae]